MFFLDSAHFAQRPTLKSRRLLDQFLGQVLASGHKKSRAVRPGSGWWRLCCDRGQAVIAEVAMR